MAKEVTITEVSTEKKFHQMVKTKDTVLVQFHASFCQPCKTLTKTVDEMVKNGSMKVNIVRVDVEEVPNIAASYGVSAIPTIILFKNGEMVARESGLKSKSQLEQFVAK